MVKPRNYKIHMVGYVRKGEYVAFDIAVVDERAVVKG